MRTIYFRIHFVPKRNNAGSKENTIYEIRFTIYGRLEVGVGVEVKKELKLEAGDIAVMRKSEIDNGNYYR